MQTIAVTHATASILVMVLAVTTAVSFVQSREQCEAIFRK